MVISVLDRVETLFQKEKMVIMLINTLPRMPILGSSNTTANENMKSKVLTNGDTIF